MFNEMFVFTLKKQKASTLKKKTYAKMRRLQQRFISKKKKKIPGGKYSKKKKKSGLPTRNIYRPCGGSETKIFFRMASVPKPHV